MSRDPFEQRAGGGNRIPSACDLQPDPRTLAALASPEQQALWQRIQAHRFEVPGQQLDLVRRLAREQGWTLFEARAVVEEYRRFCFLAVVEGRQLTPSEAVDEVWHLHLIHSRDYWQVFCPQVLRCELHHGPTQGGPSEATRYREHYAQTLAAYERWFEPPSERWWPGHAQRFADPARWQRIDRSRYWVLPRPRLASLSLSVAVLALLTTLGSGGALALPANPLDWTAGPFLALYSSLALLALLLGVRWRRAMRNTGVSSRFEPDLWQTAYLAGGRERAVDTAITELLKREAITVQGAGRHLKLRADPGELPAPLDAVARQIRQAGALRTLLRAQHPWLHPGVRQLEQRGLLLTPRQALKASLLPLLPLLAVLGFGVSKILVGLGRGKPVDFLILLCAASVFAMLLLASLRSPRSLAGDQLLHHLNLRNGRLRRAPTAEELPLAVALTGTAILATGPYAVYHQARHSPAGSGGGDGEGSGGSGCGGCGGD